MAKDRDYTGKNIIFEKMEQIIYELMTQREYYHWNKRFVALRNPKTFTEKLNYLRLHQYNNNPKVTECVDKCEVKNYMKRLGKEEYCAKTYGIYECAADIDWDSLPNQFVIKCNHGSGYNYVCKDKKRLNTANLTKQINQWMQEDYWMLHMELAYKNVKKAILIEEYLGADIETYRFCCFNGKPKAIYIATTVDGNDYNDFYNLRWEKTAMSDAGGTHIVHKKPARLEEMLELAAELSKPFPFVRVDLYEVDGKIYFSEFTFFPAGGYLVPSPEIYNQAWGRWLKI